jgi:hypothetical protein
MSAVPSAEVQLTFLNHIQRLFEEGEFVATYKYALLMSLAEIAVEKGDDSGSSIHISIHCLADKFIEFYWRQIKPYKSFQTLDTAVLVQNKGRQAAIPNLIADLQEKHSSLAEARHSKQWGSAIAKVSKIIETMPLWKLQTLRRQKVIFLYKEEPIEDGIALLPGVAFCLRQFNGFIMNLARSAWVSHIRSNPLNRSIVGDNNDLEAFMFGVDRGSLSAMRTLLTDLQKKKCFYCRNPIRDLGAVDHFIPWSRYPRDITQNFVLAHDGCNGDKSDLLAACEHLANWRERNERHKTELAAFCNASIISDELTSLGIARWAYTHAHALNSQVWVGRGVTQTLDAGYQNILA